MAVEYHTVANTYQDSVKLMRVSSSVAERFDVEEAFAVMGTEENKRMLSDAGLLEGSALEGVEPDDLLLVASDPESDRAREVLDAMETELRGEQGGGERASGGQPAPRSIRSAARRLEAPNLALVSVPGEYATREAWKALHEGLHVQIFSDNVALSDEQALKAHARETDRLVMGPDCGTAIVNGVPLGFANDVDRGPVGVVAAAGTGLQEVTSLVDRAGAGISQAIGTGGRDLQDEVGAITTKQGLELLTADEDTESIVLVSKPPDPGMVDGILAVVEECPKPVVVEFLGSETGAIEAAGAQPAESLKDAARRAVGALPGHEAGSVSFDSGIDAFAPPGAASEVVSDCGAPNGDREDVRGLFSGGSLCYEAVTELDHLDGLASNIGSGAAMDDPLSPEGHALVDLGTDELTRGRPHPMIDTTLREKQLHGALADDSVLVVLLDVVLGYGAHEDPAGSIATAVSESEGEWPVVVASVCGTSGDPQGWADQIDSLVDAGVVVCESNADASRLAAGVHGAVTGGEGA